MTNVFNGYASYDLPFGKKRAYMHDANKFVNAVLGDWQVNTVFTVHGGFPISMLDWGGDAGTGSAQGRPDCIAPSRETPFKQNPNGPGYLWFDPTTMANPAAGHLGNCPVSSERGPGIKQVDLSMSKFFPITERQSIEFRAEAINAFNTPIFTVQGYSIDVIGFGADGRSVTSTNTGVVNTSLGARNLQFALKYRF